MAGRAAAVIADLVHGDDIPLCLPPGSEAVERQWGRTGVYYRADLSRLKQWADTARSADSPAVPANRPI